MIKLEELKKNVIKWVFVFAHFTETNVVYRKVNWIIVIWQKCIRIYFEPDLTFMLWSTSVISGIKFMKKNVYFVLCISWFIDIDVFNGLCAGRYLNRSQIFYLCFLTSLFCQQIKLKISQRTRKVIWLIFYTYSIIRAICF